MSIVEMLFPASELEAMGYRSNLQAQEGAVKKRRRSSGCSQRICSSQDSGYSSDEDEASDGGPPASPKRRRPSRAISTPPRRPSKPIDVCDICSSGLVNSRLLEKYLSSMHPYDRARYGSSTTKAGRRAHDQHSRSSAFARYPSPAVSEVPPLSPCDADSPCSETSQDTRGWTAGPRSASVADLSTRIFDGIRITSHERSLLHSMIPSTEVEETPCVAMETPTVYLGFAIRIDSEDEGEATDFDDFFDLEGAAENKP